MVGARVGKFAESRAETDGERGDCMKIRMTYTAEEAQRADRMARLLCSLLPGSRVHADLCGEIRHLTISTKQGGTKENA